MIRLLPTPKRPFPGLSAALDSDHLLAIETLMPGFDPGLGAPLLQSAS